MERWSTLESILSLRIAEGRGATYRGKSKREIGDPCRVPTDTAAGRWAELLKTRVQDLLDKNKNTQLTM